MTDEEFPGYLLENLPNNVRGATIKLCDRFLEKYLREAVSYEQCLCAFSILKEFLEEHNVPYSMPEGLNSRFNDTIVKGIGEFFNNVWQKMQSLDSMEKFGKQPLSSSWQQNYEEVSTEKLELLSKDALIEEIKEQNNQIQLLARLLVQQLGEALKSSIEKPTVSINKGDFMTGNKMRFGDVGGSVTGVAGGDIKDATIQVVNSLPDVSGEQQEIKKLLAQLNYAITSEPTLEELDKEDALEEVKKLAEASKKSDEDGKKKAGKAIRTLQRIAAAVPTATALIKAFNELLPAIAKLLGLLA